MTPRVLVVGGSGWLGRRILARIPSARPLAAADVLRLGAEAVRQAMSDSEAVVVNASGARSGDRSDLESWNVAVPATLARCCAELGGHLVHLGSAAEYGTHQPHGLCAEGSDPAPESDYGRTKLSGTLAALTAGSATVLRVFNVAAVPPQAGTPLADVVDRTRAALVTGAAARLVSPRTVRDWVTAEYVATSVAAAVSRRPVGVFNVCSGVGVPIGDAVTRALQLLGLDTGVEPGDEPGGPVIGDPGRWREASGLDEELTSVGLAHVIARSVQALSSPTDRNLSRDTRAGA